MIARLVALVLLCLPLVLPAAALAQDNPFGPVPEAPPQQPAPAPAPTGSADDEGLSESEQLLLALAGVVLVAGIAFAIVRDARRSAPEERGRALDSEGRRVQGSRTPPKQRVKQSRAKAKTARQARKRNR